MGLDTPPEKAWKTRTVRTACQSEDGDFFPPFIHIPLFPPPFKRASRSISALRALRQVEAAGSGHADGRDQERPTRPTGVKEDQHSRSICYSFLVISQVFLVYVGLCFALSLRGRSSSGCFSQFSSVAP